MKSFLNLALLMALAFSIPSFATVSTTAKSYQCNKPFTQVVYLEAGGKGAQNGTSAANALPFADEDLWAIPAGAMIDRVYMVIDTAITGSTDLDVGDDDDADGFIDGSLSLTLGTPGAYSLNAKVAGAYLRVQTAGATDAGDIYVVPTSKYYAAAGKEVKLDNTTTNTAGKARVFIEGFMFCSNS